MGWIVVFFIWAALALSASVAIKKMYYTKKAFGGNVATVILLLTLTGDYDLTDGFACGIVLIFAIALIGTSIYGITSSWSNDRDLLSSEDEPNTEETGVTES